jgi:hypothetical protein
MVARGLCHIHRPSKISEIRLACINRAHCGVRTPPPLGVCAPNASSPPKGKHDIRVRGEYAKASHMRFYVKNSWSCVPQSCCQRELARSPAEQLCADGLPRMRHFICRVRMPLIAVCVTFIDPVKSAKFGSPASTGPIAALERRRLWASARPVLPRRQKENIILELISEENFISYFLYNTMLYIQ